MTELRLVPNQPLPDGNYVATIAAGTVTDDAGNATTQRSRCRSSCSPATPTATGL